MNAKPIMSSRPIVIATGSGVRACQERRQLAAEADRNQRALRAAFIARDRARRALRTAA